MTMLLAQLGSYTNTCIKFGLPVDREHSHCYKFETTLWDILFMYPYQHDRSDLLDTCQDN